MKKLILLLLVLALLAVSAVLAGRVGEKEQVTEQEGSYPLSDLAQEDIAALSWTGENGSRNFEKRGDVWVNADDEHFPVNQSALDTMASRIAGLTGTRELTDVSALADYGLAEPSLSVTAKGSDGTSVTYTMGDATPFADGYYVGVSGRDAIYTIETSLEGAFDKTDTELAAMESLPEVESATRIVIGEALDATLDEDGATWRDTATGEALDSEQVASLVEDAQALDWNAIVTASASDEALAGYGLDGASTRLTLYDGEDEALTLLLGAEDESGNRYAKLPDSGMVYTLLGSDTSALLKANADDLWNPSPVTLALDQLSEAVFTWDGGTLTLARGEDSSFTANGSAADGDAVSELWTQLTGLEGTSRVEETAIGEAIFSAEITDAAGASQRVAVYPHDVDSYLVPVSGDHALLVPAEQADRLLRQLKQMSGTL